MHLHYLVTLVLVLFATITVDISFTRIIPRYTTKLFIALILLYGIFLVRILIGVNLGLWRYGDGIEGIYLYSVPIEEYIFMIVAPYTTIVVWEAFHKIIKYKATVRKTGGKRK